MPALPCEKSWQGEKSQGSQRCAQAVPLGPATQEE